MSKKSTKSFARKTKNFRPGWRSAALKIVHPEGLHTRPAARFAKIAQQFFADVVVQRGRQKGDGKSILSLLALGAEQGHRLTIRTRGPQAEEALKALEKFMGSTLES
ncbi:MAG: HPr family phosphocarrier protein [Deltaproteobacteria bacterium]|nr:HPr family phosphocarrier protein [Deltaproteobacteria bacterium]